MSFCGATGFTTPAKYGRNSAERGALPRVTASGSTTTAWPPRCHQPTAEGSLSGTGALRRAASKLAVSARSGSVTPPTGTSSCNAASPGMQTSLQISHSALTRKRA